ncbi:MAG: amidohydrolase family protein [Paracoccaceae bacterium]|nr:amidohydrolase family protein [Paracoccaceae bacterium]
MYKPETPPPPPSEATHQTAPKGACDSHVHMLASAEEFPLWDGRVENPAPGVGFEAWLTLYRRHLAALGCTSGVIVHSIFYRTNNGITVAALDELGEGFRGIGLLQDTASEADLYQFVAWNMAGVRLNYVHGGVLSWDGLQAMAPKLAARNQHVQMLMHAHLHVEDLAKQVAQMPVDVCFDHIGWPDLSLGIAHPSVQTLCRLLAEGQVWIKLSGLYCLCKAPYDAANAPGGGIGSCKPRALSMGVRLAPHHAQRGRDATCRQIVGRISPGGHR